MIPSSTSGERRRASLGFASPVRLWDPAGPEGGGVAPPLWEALREAVFRAQTEWDRAAEHATGFDEVTAYLGQLSAALRQLIIGESPDLGSLPRNALARRLLAQIRACFVEHAQRL